MSQFSFNMSQRDGTQISSKAAKAVVALSLQYTSETFHDLKTEIIEVLKAEKIVRIETLGEGKPVSVFGWVTKYAYTAVTSYLFYKSYNHPVTQPKLHVRTILDDLGGESNAGFIHFMFKGDLKKIAAEYREFCLVEVPDVPVKEKNHNPWQQLFKTMDVLENKPIGMQKYGKDVIEKHRYIDLLISGRPLHIWLGSKEEPYNRADYGIGFLMQWLQSDMEAAYKIANDRMEAGDDRKKQRADFTTTNVEVIEGTAPAPKVDKKTGEQKLLVKVRGKTKRVNLMTYPACKIRLYNVAMKRFTGSDRWDPNNPTIVSLWVGNPDQERVGFAERYEILFQKS